MILLAKVKDAAAHALTSYLFSLGMALTLLGVTGLMQHGVLAASLLLLMHAALVPASIDRRIRLGGGCLLLAVGLISLPAGSASSIAEVMQALILHMSGLTTALPMVGAPFTIIICILCACVSWFVTQRSAGAFPALILLVMAAILLWLGGWADVLPCLMPATVACVMLLLRTGDEQISILRVLPLSAIVTLLAFSGVFLGGVVSPPMKSMADAIRQRIYDTFFYTQPRDVFTLASEGYYPQGIGQMGGPATPHEEPVMAVITPQKAYLRGVIKNIYTGRTWTDDLGQRRYLYASTRFDALRTSTFDQALPYLDSTADASLLSPTKLQVRMLRDSASTLFVPQRLRSLTAEGSLVPYFNAASEVFATANLTIGDVWTMDAALFTANDAGIERLVLSADAASDPAWETVRANYLQLHNDIDQRVYAMTQQAIGNAQTDFAKARSIQQFLAANFTYTLDAPEQSPQHDFVSTFLIEAQEGYCIHFASAMTVMCRIAGLPARYVEGYVAYPDEEGLAIVTGNEGHAWTEVYFRGFGWVTFDATPTSVDHITLPPDQTTDPSDAPHERSPEGTPEPTSTPEPTAVPETTPPPEPSAPKDEPSPVPTPSAAPGEADSPAAQDGASAPWWWLLILAALATAVLRVVMVQPEAEAKRQKTEFARWLVWIQAIHDALRCQGLRREPSESPAAFFRRAEGSTTADVSLQGLAAAENLMFYGHAAPYAEETAQAKGCFQALYRALSTRQKLRFQLERTFLPGKRRHTARL